MRIERRRDGNAEMMRWLARYAVRRAVGRVIWIVVGLVVFGVLSFFGIGNAHAQSHCGAPHLSAAAQAAGSSLIYGNEGEAFSACNGIARDVAHGDSGGDWMRHATFDSCEVDVVAKKVTATFNDTFLKNPGSTPACSENNPISGSVSVTGWSYSSSCADRLPLEGHFYGATGAYALCESGCVFQGEPLGRCLTIVVDAEESRYCDSWVPSGLTCTPGAGGFPSTPPGQTPPDGDSDGSSDGNDSSPNNPGQGGGGMEGGSDEDGNCGGEGQPECGNPGSGSGNGNTSGGGGDCGTPPSSTGDPILAQIAFQAWKTRCAVEARGDGDDDDDGDDGRAERTADGQALEGDINAMEAEFGTNIFDDSAPSEAINPNWLSFGGGLCPDLSVSLPWGGAWAPPAAFCSWISWLGVFFQLIAMVWALRIIAEG
ncbi:hypothetical protein [Luteimonas salinilitoris]|uniref:hypothetical protein n=1 Tax=Luteimonas salinilitoris TaxID=3237697 RepID=UPI00351BEF32